MDFYTQIGSEIEEFLTARVQIGQVSKGQAIKYLSSADNSNSFSQWDTLNKIDLYWNSKFVDGAKDSEGQRKVFLNIITFICDVATKNIDLDVKDILFIPENPSDRWLAYFLQKEFKFWAKKNDFGKLLNDIVQDLPKYGTVVLKKVGKTIKRVPLRTLRNPIDCKCLDTADFVIEEHDYSYSALQRAAEKHGWDISDVEPYTGKAKFYERYGFMSEESYNKLTKKKGGDKKKMVDVFTLSHLKKKEGSKYPGSLLFAEIVTKRPYYEVHWSKQDGRWLGVGEAEKQFENQVMRNSIENLRRRAMLWSSKKVFQSSSDEVQDNLITDVKDGTVLKIDQGGEVTAVDMSNRALVDFNAATSVWAENSSQKSFTFEVATGQSMPSGTPFRLGVVLSNAVSAHYQFKKEILGLFIKEVVEECIVPQFKRDISLDHVLRLANDEEGIQDLKEEIARLRANQIYHSFVLDKGVLPDYNEILQFEMQKIDKEPAVFVSVLRKEYDDIDAKIEVEVTGEAINTESRMTTYTNIFQTLASNPAVLQMPEMRRLLGVITSQTGENLESVLGPITSSPEQMPQGPAGTPPKAQPIQ